MATTIAAGHVAVTAGSSIPVTSRAANLVYRKSASQPRLIRCNAKGVQGERSSCAESSKNGASLKLSVAAVVVPALAAAFVGSVQPAVQAAEWDKFVLPVESSATTSSTDEPYKDLLEKMKERRAARERKAPSVQAEEPKSDTGASTYSSPFFSPAPVYTPPASPPPPPVVKTVEPAPAPPVDMPSPAQSTPVVEAEKQKTHGFLPLFLTQFLLLVATVGGGFVLITTPDSKWVEVQKTVDGYVAKATPIVEDSWAKAKPVAIQAQQKASEFAETAKPYMVKAWEASKPILKSAQTKAAELFEQATSKK
ncbi:unnamed protein product [Calypogeia fissa]